MENDPTPINARPKRRPPQGVEDFALALREHVLWPAEDWVLGLSDRGRALAAGGAVAAAIILGVGGFALVAGGGSGSAGNRAAEVAVAAPTPAQTEPATEPQRQPEATLHGAAPVFKPAPKEDAKVGGSEAVSKQLEEEAATARAGNTGAAATDTISSSPNPNADAAGASARAATSAAVVDGPPAGPAAIAVAREFAEGFVDYEVGTEKSTVRRTFAKTATPELRRALLQRPPRQPSGVKVPKAKVLNLVPAPSHGTIYPVSVSLLRVGVTSELRLELEQLKNKEWRVVNALG